MKKIYGIVMAVSMLAASAVCFADEGTAANTAAEKPAVAANPAAHRVARHARTARMARRATTKKAAAKHTDAASDTSKE